MRIGMFGTVTACRHVLGDRHDEWVAAMCGVCLAIRDRAGHIARTTTSTDAIATAVLAADLAATAGGDGPPTRRAGPCPARGMRRADVWTGAPAALGAGVSLLSASVAVRDKTHDGDLPRVVGPIARGWADRIDTHAANALRAAGIDLDRIGAALAASRDAERRRSDVLADWTEPVADAYGAVFAPLGMEDVGTRVGRVTLLTDAIEDRDDDHAVDRPNPILAGACTAGEARRLVHADVAAVGTSVAAALPNTLSSLLWGPGLTHGVRTRLHHGCASACTATATATATAADTDTDDAPVWPTKDEAAETEHRRSSRRRARDRESWWWCDGCDACCCPCEICDACDCCDCCSCDC